ncbi:hypothetical protein D3C77_569030 [compost metagenome]
MIHHQNQIRILNRRQTVGNNKACSPLHELIHCFLDINFRPRIHAARCFIQNKNSRIGENSPGNRQQLLLALRNVGGLLIQDRIVAVGQRTDEVIRLRRLCRLDNVLLSCSLSSIGDVVANRAIEQPCILQHHSE